MTSKLNSGSWPKLHSLGLFAGSAVVLQAPYCEAYASMDGLNLLSSLFKCSTLFLFKKYAIVVPVVLFKVLQFLVANL